MSVMEIMIVTLELRVLIWLDLTLVPVMMAGKVLATSVMVSVMNQKNKTSDRESSELCAGRESKE